MKALFAGSFHPPTKGHLELIKKAAGMFDGVVVAIMINAEKKYTISAEERKRMLEKCVADIPNAEVVIGTGLTASLAEETGCRVLLRGVRDTADFEYEKRIAAVNRALTGIETVFLLPGPELGSVASSIVMDIARHGGDISAFVPAEIKQDIAEAIKKEKES